MKVFDISPTLHEGIAVFPGDTRFKKKFLLDFPKDHLSLSQILFSAHTGSHADAPYHYHQEGLTIEKQNLEIYLGKAQVIDVSGKKIIKPEDLPEISAPRVLFKTSSYQSEQWTDDFTYLDPQTVHFLAKKNVFLLGMDTPSVDAATSKDLPSHHAVYENKMNIVEGLDLSKVNAGIYFFIGLPLKIKGGDASPIRAVLISDFEVKI